MPLHLRLLDAIAKNPGISRRGLHEATGNRVKADDMEAALAILEAQGLAHRRRCQPEGGGRPAECWWLGPGNDPGDDDPSDDSEGSGVTFTMGGGNRRRHRFGFRFHPGSRLRRGRRATGVGIDDGGIQGDATGLRTKEQTPAPTPAPEIISSQSFFAGGNATGGIAPAPIAGICLFFRRGQP